MRLKGFSPGECIASCFIWSNRGLVLSIRDRIGKYLFLLTICLLGSLITAWLFLIIRGSNFAWDAFDFWLLETIRLIETITIENGDSEYEYLRHRNERHPPLLIYFYATAELIWLGSVKILSAAGFVVMTFLIVRRRSLDFPALASLFMAYWILSLSPLVENHVILFGYSEVWLGLALSLCVYVAPIDKQDISVLPIFTLLVLLVAVSLMRNTGWVYATALFVSWGGTLIVRSFAFRVSWAMLKYFALFMVALFLVAYFAASNMESMSLFGRSLGIEYFGLFPVFVNELYSKLMHTSFSVLVLSYILIVIGVFSSHADVGDQREFARFIFGSFAAAIIAFALFTSQLFIDHAFFNAVPSHDTGNSRFFIPVVFLVLAVIPSGLHCIIRSARLSR